ncbi:MAG TPA: protein kinase [Hyalangium sp.]|jgi:serine/threonine-protein kinase|nr:protein kinase [Hyalangium sp.]
MAIAGSGTGPVILFTHEGIAYEYRESLGVGPHGEVLLLARQRTHDNILEDVIVKHVALPPGEPSAQTLRIRARLEEEAQLARYLGHRALVRVRFRHETPEGLYTVREHVRGPTLDDLVTLALEREKNFPEAFILYVGAELASALAHVHACEDGHGQPLGIVHRNVNPPSIVFTWRGGVKLADFSLAYSKLSGRRATTLRRPRGSLFFTAPETLFDGQVEARSDLFALGLVLLELATGRHLYDPPHQTQADVAAALSSRERRRVERAMQAAKQAGYDETTVQAFWGAAAFSREDVARATDGLSAPLKFVLDRLLRRNTEERFQTAAELEDALRARLAVVGPYDGAAAVAELRKAVAEVGQTLVAHEVTPGLLAPSPERVSPETTTR